MQTRPTSPIILIDGYNLLGIIEEESGVKEKLGNLRHELFLALNRYRLKTKGYRIWVVFDSRFHKESENFKAAGIKVFFSTRKTDADSFIVNLVRSNIGKVFLVTSDFEIIDKTFGLVLGQIYCEDFLHKYLYPERNIVERSLVN